MVTVGERGIRVTGRRFDPRRQQPADNAAQVGAAQIEAAQVVGAQIEDGEPEASLESQEPPERTSLSVVEGFTVNLPMTRNSRTTAQVKTSAKTKKNLSRQYCSDDTSSISGASDRENQPKRTRKPPPPKRPKLPSFSAKNRAAAKENASGEVAICCRCQNRFNQDSMASDSSLCAPCLLLSTAVAAQTAKGGRGRGGKNAGAVKKVHETSLVEELNGSMLSLQDLCIKLITTHIDKVESFGEISDRVRDRICHIMSKHRQLRPTTMHFLFDVQLTNLTLYDYLDEDALMTVAHFNPNLKSLHLKECGQISDAVLDVYRTNLPNLVEFSLCGCYLISDACMARFLESRNGTLAMLGLEYSPKLGPISAGAFPSSLRRLRLQSCSRVDTQFLECALVHVPNLVELSLSENVGITDDAVQLVATRLPQLERFSVNGCHRITDASLAAIASMPASVVLTELGLSDLPGITDDGLVPVAQRHTRLEHLDLSRCSQIGDEGLEGFVKNLPAKLTHLNCNGIKDLSAEMIHLIAEHLQATLVTLDLSWCQALTDELLQEFARAPNLQCISVWGCGLVTDVGVKLFERSSSARLFGSAHL